MHTEVMIFNRIRMLRCDGVACALLRDNVQHYLENGAPSGRFWAMHALADTRWAERAEILNPLELACELDVAWPCLRKIPIELLAISIRTRAALSSAGLPPDVRGTILYRLVQWPLPFELEGLATLDDLFGDLVADLDRLVRESRPDDELVMRSVAAAAVQTLPSPLPSKWLH